MSLDWSILYWIQSHTVCDLFDLLMPKLTLLGSGGAVWLLAAGGLLCSKKYRRQGVILLAGLAVGVLVGNCCRVVRGLIARLLAVVVATVVTSLGALLLAAVSGAISIMRMSSAKPDYGTSYMMFSILICVFGGTNPDGGKGSVTGIVLATIVLQMVSTLMNMFSSISAFYRDVVWGALLIIMLIVNYVLDTRKVASR